MYIKEFKRDACMSRLVRGSQYTSHFRKLQSNCKKDKTLYYLCTHICVNKEYRQMYQAATREDGVK